MTTHPPASYLTPLASLRGLAALGVVAFHYRNFFPSLTPHMQWAAKGYLWVDLFFILSGFILTHVYGKTFEHGWGKKEYKGFLIARLARVYPMHVASLLLMVAMEALAWVAAQKGWMHPDTPPFTSVERNGWGILSNLLLVHAWGVHSVSTWNGPSWSISTEWAAYLLFPLLLPWLARRSTSVLIGAALAGWVIDILLCLHHGSLDITYDWAVPRCLAGFVAGMALYRLHQKGIWAWTARDMTVIAVVLALAICLTQGLPDWACLPFFWLLILGLAGGRDRAKRLMEWRPFAWLGEISYSLYMLHIPLFLAAANAWKLLLRTSPGEGWNMAASLAGLGGLLAALILVSAAGYYLVERPARSWLRGKSA